MAWAHDGWDLLTKGTLAYRTELSLHIKEVSEHLTNRNYNTQGKSHSADALSRYLDRLMMAQSEALATPIIDAPSSQSQVAPFVRARPT